MRKRLAPWLVALAAAFALLLATPASAAAAAVVDPTRPCSLTIRKYLVDERDPTSAVPAAGAVFGLARVPDLDLATAEGWRAAAALADGDPLAVPAVPVAEGVTDARGEVVFRNLPVGLYRVTETASDGAEAGAPFLVTLPTTDPDSRDQWLYDVVVHPKAPLPVPAPVYDLALRTWVSEIWRDGVRVFERQSATTDPGPDFAVPHATFDDDGVDVQVGDLLVHDIHLFNQGDRTARVDELVSYAGDGLDHARTAHMDAVPGHDNDGWELGIDGLWHLAMDDAGIVLAPGETYEVHRTLVVLPEALGAGVDSTDVLSFVEISRFSGWVPEAPSAQQAANVAAQAAEMHDGTLGSWQAVADVDSFPDRVNEAVEGTQLVLHSWEDNEIHESNTSMAWDDDLDHDNDEDDHDGETVQIVRAANAVPPPTSRPPLGQLPRTGASVAVLLLAAGALVITGRHLVRGVRNDH